MFHVILARRPRALLLDTERPPRRLEATTLASLDWDAEEAAFFDEAQERLRHGGFDVVIANYHLAQANAFHFICCLRRDGVTVPAIVMADDPKILRLAPRELLHIPAVLLRPFTTAQLKEALAQVLKAGPAAPVPRPRN